MLKYHHVSRSTPNLEGAIAFYSAIGCTLEKRVSDDVQHLERAQLTLPGSSAVLQLIHRRDGPVTPPGLDWTEHLAFHTTAFDDALNTLLEAGARVEREPYRLRPDAGRIAFVLDPDGHRIELVEK
jgi:catechol 2,3-dioxygenase-like lactoylglutathione lyase family enzyme